MKLSPITPPELRRLVALARDVAMCIHPLEKVLALHNLTSDQYATIQVNEFFKRTLEAAMVDWHGARNTPERIKLEAAATLEEWLPQLNARMHNMDEGLPAVIEGGKLLAKIAGIGEREVGSNNSEKFVINIDLGNQKIEVEKEIKLVEGTCHTKTQNENELLNALTTSEPSKSNEHTQEPTKPPNPTAKSALTNSNGITVSPSLSGTQCSKPRGDDAQPATIQTQQENGILTTTTTQT